MAINTLTSDLGHVANQKEVIRDGRFVATGVFPKGSEGYRKTYRRELSSGEEWAEVCAEHGKDPQTTAEFSVPVYMTTSRGHRHILMRLRCA